MVDPFELYQVLEAEYEDLHGALPYAIEGLDAEARLKAVCDAVHKLPKKRAALCFSGGGIRSATFGLGVLQGLARKGLLTEFDYLSTVSGGGYLGGWFSAWLRRESERSNKRARAALESRQARQHFRVLARLLNHDSGSSSESAPHDARGVATARPRVRGLSRRRLQ